MSLDEARLKEIDDLTDEDKTSLQDNRDDLTEDERETFKDVIEEEGAAFKTKEEVDKYLEEKWAEKTEKEETAKKDAEEAEREEEERKAAEKKGEAPATPFFDPKYKAEGWEGFAQDFYKKATPRFIEAMRKAQGEDRAKQQTQIDKINQGFDQELEDLRKAGEPIPEKGTKERLAFNKELAKVGTEFRGVSNMTDAYKIYKATKGTRKSGVAHDTARRVGGGGATPGGKQKERKYKDVASRTMDEVEQAAVKKYRELA